jgi:ABC-type Fe3+ transport system permease subunit
VALISPGALLLMLLAVGPLAIPGSVIAAGWCYDRVCANESRATDGTLGRSVATARSAN